MVAVVGVCVAALWIGCVCEGRRCGGRGQGRVMVWRCTDVRVCSDGMSPLTAASLGGHVSCVEALIRGTADVLQCDQ
jgi:hypothetical protein